MMDLWLHPFYCNLKCVLLLLCLTGPLQRALEILEEAGRWDFNLNLPRFVKF